MDYGKKLTFQIDKTGLPGLKFFDSAGGRLEGLTADQDGIIYLLIRTSSGDSRLYKTAFDSDDDKPSVKISSNTSILRSGETATITFSFNKPVSFKLDSISIEGGKLSNLSGSGLTYSATFSPEEKRVASARIHVDSGAISRQSGLLT